MSESSVSVEKRTEFVECLSFVLGEIREAALDNSPCPRQVEVAFRGMMFGKNFDTSYRLPSLSKKVEFGGVLFGKKGATRVRIIAFRPLISEHAFGGGATLSEHDRQAVAELIVRMRADGDLCELEPLGWFRAHPMSDLRLSKWDTELFNYFFNEPWQIGLVVRPAKSAPTRARFFLRESDGALHPEGYQELVVPTIPRNLLLRLNRKTAADPLKRAARAALPVSVPMQHRAPGTPSWTAVSTVGIVLVLANWWASSPARVTLPAPFNHPPAANQDANREEQTQQQAAALWKKFEEETSRQIQQDEAAAAKQPEEALTRQLQPPPRKELATPPARKPAPAVPVQTTSLTEDTPPDLPPTRQNPPGAKAPVGDFRPEQVVHQVLPEVSREARDTIQGTVRVRVKVRADPSGSVVVATLDSPGPSRYFAELALQAARRWKFSPVKIDGRDVSSEWILRFEFVRDATRVFPVCIGRPADTIGKSQFTSPISAPFSALLSRSLAGKEHA